MVALETIKNGICYMCMTSCPIKIHVSNGKATKIDMVDDRVADCPRWQAQLDFIYHPDRLKYPIKRVGERGGGKWQRISWDEALDTMASKIKESKERYGPESIGFNFCDGDRANCDIGWALLTALGSPMVCGTDAHYCLRPQATASMVTFGKGIFFTGHEGLDLPTANACSSGGPTFSKANQPREKKSLKH